MKTIKDYLSTGIILLSTMLSPSISESHSTPYYHRPNSEIRTSNHNGIYNLPLEYEFNIPHIPRELLLDTDRFERIFK